MAESPSRAADDRSGRIELGRIVGAFGVGGWVRLQSYTEPPEQILDFAIWHADQPGSGCCELRPLRGRRHGKGLVAQLAGVDSRTQAAALARSELWVERRALPAPMEGEYYRADLVGLTVETLDGQVLGRVDHFLDTPANPVMVVIGEREHWLPAVPRHLRRVDLEGGRITVDWDPDF